MPCNKKSLFASLVLFLSFFALACVAAENTENAKDDSPEKKEEKKAPEKTENTLTSLINGKSMEYVVKTDLISLQSDDDEENALVFSTSYQVKDGSPGRPVLFLYNGGPGASSIYLHIGAFGPKGFLTRDSGTTPPKPPYAVEDNQDSLLDVTDLVFIDPVGTGYSRAADGKKESGDGKEKDKGAAKESNKDFWDVDKDIDSIAEFIRVWLTENNRWGSPVFLGGESYGGLRTAGLAGELEDAGVAPSGVILISPVISYMDVWELNTRENRNAPILLFPSLAMTAHYHGRLDAGLQAMDREAFGEMVKEWCESDYLPALRRGNRLGAVERKQLAEKISEFCGLPTAVILAENLIVSQSVFCSYLLRDQHRFLSGYDGRATAYGSKYDYGEDPTNSVAGESYRTTFMRLLTETLGLKASRRYRFMSPDAFIAWDFTQGGRGLGGFPSTVRHLGTAMRRFPNLKVFAALGRYDLVTPPYSVLHSLARLDIPSERVGDIVHRMYEGGHMMYTNVEAKKQLADDLRRWIKETITKRD